MAVQAQSSGVDNLVAVAIVEKDKNADVLLVRLSTGSTATIAAALLTVCRPSGTLSSAVGRRGRTRCWPTASSLL